MAVQWSQHTAVRAARTTLSTRLAIGPILTLDNIAITRIIGLVEGGNAVEIAAKAAGRCVDQFARIEVVAPRVIIDAYAMGWLRFGCGRHYYNRFWRRRRCGSRGWSRCLRRYGCIGWRECWGETEQSALCRRVRWHSILRCWWSWISSLENTSHEQANENNSSNDKPGISASRIWRRNSWRCPELPRLPRPLRLPVCLRWLIVEWWLPSPTWVVRWLHRHRKSPYFLAKCGNLRKNMKRHQLRYYLIKCNKQAVMPRA